MRIKELRIKHGISQIELANKLGIARNTLSQYETDKRKPTPDMLASIAEFLGESIYDVMGISPAAAQVVKDDPLIALYGETKAFLDEDDLEDIQTIMRLRAERKKARRDADNEG